MRFHVRMGVQASVPRRPHVGPFPILAGVLGTIALGVAAAVVIAVCLVHIATSAASVPAVGTPGAVPSQHPLNPGTYSAGALNAPTRLGALQRLTLTQQSQVELVRSQRDALHQATGKPAIAAEYGRPATLQVLPVALVASSGYVDPRQYLGSVGSGKVTLSTQGQDECAVYANLAVLCVRSDQQRQLTVAVEGTLPYVRTAHAAAVLVDDGWKKVGG